MALTPQQLPSSLPGLTRQSMGRSGFPQRLRLWHVSMDARVIGERSDAVLQTAKPAHDEA
jgi:hypothetical protein